MTVTELLTQFANPEVMQTLSVSDKLYAGLITTILGMGITFSALIILQFIIGWMDKILNKSTPASVDNTTATTAVKESPAPEADTYQDDRELVAVITATLAMQLKTSVENIVIKNIEKVEDSSPSWNRAGIIEQMNSRL